MCAYALWSLILSSTFCPFLYTAPFTTHESGFARTSWLTTHPFNTPWSATPLTGGSRDTSCGIHRTLSWGRRDDRDSVGVIGAGVIGADQVGALQLSFFTYLEKSLPEEHWKASKSWILSCRVVSKLVLIKHSHFQLEASSTAMRQNMLHDRLVLPPAMTQTAVKRRLLTKKSPKKWFPSEIFQLFWTD